MYEINLGRVSMTSNDVAKVFGVIVFGLAIVFFNGLITGWLVYLLWDHTIPYIFTKAVTEGWLPKEIGFWDAVFLSWITGALFKDSRTSTNNSN